MDCKIISRLFSLIILLTSTQLNAIEFKGKFLQGHFIVGITNPSAKIIVDKKEVLLIYPKSKEQDIKKVVASAANINNKLI